jgi:hypothetical protein
MTDDISAITEANRVSWNQIAGRRHGNPADFYRDNGVSLEDFERELAGDVTGRRVLQLACSHGDEVLSWANLGATAVGIDISDVAIESAKRKAAEATIAAEFRQADIFELPADLTEFDLIYFSWGAICWADRGRSPEECRRRSRWVPRCWTGRCHRRAGDSQRRCTNVGPDRVPWARERS